MHLVGINICLQRSCCALLDARTPRLIGVLNMIVLDVVDLIEVIQKVGRLQSSGTRLNNFVASISHLK